MVDEENVQEPKETPEEKPQLKKKPIIFIGGFALFFILCGAVNFIHLQMTYVPPEPQIDEALVVHEDEGPILEIDLSEDKLIHFSEEALVGGGIDSLGVIEADSMSTEDSIKLVIEELQANINEGDSLLAAAVHELEKTKALLNMQEAEEDSSNLKKSIKLAKIVGNMPPKEAARMLEPLEDLMVLDVLMRLKQRQAAKIMAEFSAQRAARLSEVILKPLVQG
jgi:hypothetical protein